MATSFATPELALAWKYRKAELKQERLQRYNDLLHENLVRTFTLNREDIETRLAGCVSTATSASDLTIPIYVYDYRWTIHDLSETYAVSHYQVITRTDLCDRLAQFFGAENFVVRNRKLDDTRYHLMLHYYPDGVNEETRLVAEQCARKYASHAPVFVRDVEWQETYTYRQEGGYATPPRPVTFAPPPPPELLRHRGYIREYTGVHDAARDLGEELLRECYCQHGSDSE